MNQGKLHLCQTVKNVISLHASFQSSLKITLLITRLICIQPKLSWFFPQFPQSLLATPGTMADHLGKTNESCSTETSSTKNIIELSHWQGGLGDSSIVSWKKFLLLLWLDSHIQSFIIIKLLLSAVFLDHVSYRGCWPISQITHQSTWKWRNDRCSELNLICNCVKTPEKKSQDFNRVWTHDLAIPVWYSTDWAMKPLTLGAGQ